jgi:hypothetical protein
MSGGRSSHDTSTTHLLSDGQFNRSTIVTSATLPHVLKRTATDRAVQSNRMARLASSETVWKCLRQLTS